MWRGGVDMADLVLLGIFILCAVIGYIVVKRSGGLLEQMLFQKSEMWYHLRESNVRESNEPCRDAGAGNACSQTISRDSGSIGRSDRSSQESDAAPARGPRAERNKSFFGQGTDQESKRAKTPASTAHKPKDFKAGVRHEWKASRRGPKQQVWKPQ